MVGGIDLVLSNAGVAAVDMAHRAIDYSHAQVNDNQQVKETQKTQIFEMPMMRKPGFTANDQAVKSGEIGAVVQVTVPQSKDKSVGHNFQISA